MIRKRILILEDDSDLAAITGGGPGEKSGAGDFDRGINFGIFESSRIVHFCKECYDKCDG